MYSSKIAVSREYKREFSDKEARRGIGNRTKTIYHQTVAVPLAVTILKKYDKTVEVRETAI